LRLRLFCRDIWTIKEIREKMDKITFQLNENETAELYVVEQTRIAGVNYLLVSEEESGDSEAYILKEVSAAEDTMGEYTDELTDKEFEAVAAVFSELLEDIDLA